MTRETEPSMRLALASFVAIMAFGPLSAQPPRHDAKAVAEAIAPFIDEQTLAVIHIVPARIDPAELARLVAPLRAYNDQEKQRFQDAIAKWKEQCQKLTVQHAFLLVSLADSNNPIAYVLPCDTADPNSAAALLEPFIGKAKLGSGIKGRASFAGSKVMVGHLKSIKPVERPELVAAFEAAGDGDIQAVLIPSSDQRRAIEEVMPLVPQELGSGPMKSLTRGVIWAAASATLTPKFSVRLRIQSESPAAAKVFSQSVPDLLNALGKELTRNPADPFDGKFKLAIAGNQLHANISEQDVVQTFSDFFKSAREWSDRGWRTKNLGKIALAIWNHFEAYNYYPGWAFYGPAMPAKSNLPFAQAQTPYTKPNKDAKPLLSWRVMILPYLGYDNLFRQFKFDEPWDSEHNRKLIAQMPAEFRTGNPKIDEAGKTRILVPVGERTIFPPNGECCTPAQVSDGLFMTIMIVEAAVESVAVWTKPGDWEFDPKAVDPIKGLLNPNANGFLASFARGQVSVISKDLGPTMLRLLFTRDSGMPKHVPDGTPGTIPR
jgi:hypothetical protein